MTEPELVKLSARVANHIRSQDVAATDAEVLQTVMLINDWKPIPRRFLKQTDGTLALTICLMAMFLGATGDIKWSEVQ